MPLSVAGVGFIALFGVAVLNGVVLVCLQLKVLSASYQIKPRQAALLATMQRLVGAYDRSCGIAWLCPWL